MDEFFQKLRKIQKNERSNSGLARVEDNFYHQVHRYLEDLMHTVDNDPFSLEHDLFKDAQRIATEICERREHKIADSAVMNIQRSYHLFKGKPQFDLQDTTPLNLTPEEEKFYFSLLDILKGHRNRIIPAMDIENGSSNLEAYNIDKSSSKSSFSSEEELKDNSTKFTINKDLLTRKKPQDQISKEINDKKNYIGSKKYNELASKANKFDFKTLIIFEELPSILGVDQKVYGPFYPQDVIILPEPNAQIFVNSRKGRFIQ